MAILLTKQKESKGSTDFVLATLHKGKPELFKIQNEKIEYDINHFWLGAKEGFEVYQQNFHNPQVTEELLALYKYCPKIIDPTESSLKTRMRSSFKKVIERNLKGTA